MAERQGKVVRQAAFLMAAQLISSVIGLLYRSPLHMLMGDLGDGYYQYAYEWYTIILLISSYSIPSAVSKVMAERLAVRKYRNAFRVFKAALLYVTIVGAAGALVAWFGGPFILRKTPGAVLALRVLAPTIFLSGFLGVLRGFFQAHNTMKPTAFSQVTEQILNAVFSVLMAYLLTRPYAGNEENTGRFGAAGGAAGTGAGVVAGLLVMLLAYHINHRMISRRVANDRSGEEESYKEAFRVMIMMCTPIILATCVYNVTSVVDQSLFTSLMASRGYASDFITKRYGLFGYRVRPIINIPIALASATSTALIPAVATSMAAGKKDEAVGKIDECVKMTMFIAIPAAFGIAILSYPIIYVLYPSGDVSGAAVLLSLGAVSVIFYSLSTVSNGVLQGLGHPSIPVINAAVGLGVNILAVILGVRLFDMNVYAIVLATVLYSFTVMVLNMAAIRHYTGYHNHVSRFSAPILASLVMSLAVAAVYWGPKLIAGDFFGRYLISAVLMVIAVLLGVLVYFVIYDRIAGLSDEEVRRMPMGTRVLRLMKRLHVRK